MKVLIVGNFASWAIENYYVKYLREMGVEVECFDSSKYYSKKLSWKIFSRIFPKLSFRNANLSLLKVVKSKNIDIVWIFKGREYYPETLRLIKKMGVKLVNYNPDHPFIRTAHSHGGKNVEDCIPLYDLHFCYSKDLMQKIEKEYKIPTTFLPFGYELSEENFQAAIKEQEINHVCFVGNPDNIRMETINFLATQDVIVYVFGIGWHLVKMHKNVIIGDAIFGEEFWSVLRKFRVQLNIFRPHNINSHNMRSFEIPAVGGIMLAPKSEEHREFFEEGKEVFLYSDLKDLLNKILFLLSMPQTEINRIRAKAMQKSIENKYTYRNNSEVVKGKFENLISEIIK